MTCDVCSAHARQHGQEIKFRKDGALTVFKFIHRHSKRKFVHQNINATKRIIREISILNEVN